MANSLLICRVTTRNECNSGIGWLGLHVGEMLVRRVQRITKA
jgi:hypothetical protein